MNAEAPVSGVTPPPSPRSLADTGLSMVMMRDILLKTMFRTNQDQVTALSKAISLPVPLTQELVDLARTQKLLTATGTMPAYSAPRNATGQSLQSCMHSSTRSSRRMPKPCSAAAISRIRSNSSP